MAGWRLKLFFPTYPARHWFQHNCLVFSTPCLWKYVSSWSLSKTSWMKSYFRVRTLNIVNKAKFYPSTSLLLSLWSKSSANYWSVLSSRWDQNLLGSAFSEVRASLAESAAFAMADPNLDYVEFTDWAGAINTQIIKNECLGVFFILTAAMEWGVTLSHSVDHPYHQLKSTQLKEADLKQKKLGCVTIVAPISNQASKRSLESNWNQSHNIWAPRWHIYQQHTYIEYTIWIMTEPN